MARNRKDIVAAIIIDIWGAIICLMLVGIILMVMVR